MKPVLITCLLIIICSCYSNNQDKIIGLHQNIHHDDFEYSVSNLIISKFLKAGNDTLKANGVFYLVMFRVENKAKRVEHNWDNSIGYIVDERNTTFENITEVQQFWQKANDFGFKEQYTTRPGSADSTWLAFDLPLNVTKPALKVRGPVLMGDVFDMAKFRKTRIRLY